MIIRSAQFSMKTLKPTQSNIISIFEYTKNNMNHYDISENGYLYYPLVPSKYERRVVSSTNFHVFALRSSMKHILIDKRSWAIRPPSSLPRERTALFSYWKPIVKSREEVLSPGEVIKCLRDDLDHH